MSQISTDNRSANELVLITGMSGSGKSVALRGLEDIGFFCVDNLPPELLSDLVEVKNYRNCHQLAIAIDARSAESLPEVSHRIRVLRAKGIDVRSIFLDATTDTLVRRYSESKRRHPLSATHGGAERHALIEAIELERKLLLALRDEAHVIDTSIIRSTQLVDFVNRLATTQSSPITIVLESFAFKRGIPVDADFVFDARALPNPFYEEPLRALTGRDGPVQSFLAEMVEPDLFSEEIIALLNRWIPRFQKNKRSYVTVAVGCTGGQHRSVYVVERVHSQISHRWAAIRRHRELD